jgi:hypothetical protein
MIPVLEDLIWNAQVELGFHTGQCAICSKVLCGISYIQRSFLASEWMVDDVLFVKVAFAFGSDYYY